MSYRAVAEMSKSSSLRDRVTAAAATEGKPDPSTWSAVNMWQVAASPGWADAWSYAVETATTNQNPDTGARTDVISDAMILAAVQAVV